MTSVKQKRAAIERKCNEVAAGARKVEAGIKEQEKINKAAVAKIESGVKHLEANTKAYIKNFYFGE